MQREERDRETRERESLKSPCDYTAMLTAGNYVDKYGRITSGCKLLPKDELPAIQTNATPPQTVTTKIMTLAYGGMDAEGGTGVPKLVTKKTIIGVPATADQRPITVSAPVADTGIPKLITRTTLDDGKRATPLKVMG